MINQEKGTDKILQIQEILSRQCPKHNEYPLDLLYITNKSNQHEICYMCFQSYPIKKEEIINIRQILFAKEDTVLQNYPPLENQNLYTQLINIFNEQMILDQSIIKIQQFFKEFEEKLIGIIKQLQRDMENKIENIKYLKKQLVETYNSISQKSELKNYFQNNNKDNSALHDLISKKFDELPENTQKIKELIDKFNTYKRSVNFDGPVKIEEAVISLMNQIDFFSDFNAEKYTQIIFQQELNDNHKYQLLNTSKQKKTNVDYLLELIKNQTNYCNNSSYDEIQKLLKKYSLLLNQIELNQPIWEEAKRNSFVNLSDQQLERVRLISEKIISIDKQYEENEASSSLKEDSALSDKSLQNYQPYCLQACIQPNSYEIYNNLFSGKASQYQRFQNLLKEYPIFELDSVQVGCHQLIFFNMIKSIYADSQNLHIQRLPNLNIQIQKINKKGHAICYSNTQLEEDKKYLIRLTIQSNPKNSNNLILFGLIPEQSKDISYLRDSGLTYNERADSCYTLTKLIKGDPIPEINKLNINKQIEIRIHLKKKLFRIATIPGYENISELDNRNRIKDNLNYRFGIELYQQDDQIIINEFMVEDQFNDDM
ncbi:hypothetical protein TTHERM_00576820 (macronuclear) [Tetrahymena thermophila SB210]|uniref:Zinc carboxypeptidase family protein n=1 Tax=Tetrahymena thermophila (strain SB210) TaxID=312017 RepID=Q22V17_TETTS|nr:hypothetical protein TTHERM_00576820 [Tetrahymena thermophila SB210]EAR89131.1 hypothetical protein TTHERM_00576820 [Tetrahymena thermophila SB210]|eukprot:XP_001009376.1 hypothetical protein TTHERM_00576820 [Tetrahymena thermophila SB210]